jgi:hypothetical protein
MLNLAIRVCHRFRLRCACRLRRPCQCCQITGQRRNRLFLSHIRTPFGRTFIAHSAYREKQRILLSRMKRSLSLDAMPGCSVDTGGTYFVPGRQAGCNRVALESCNRGTGARVSYCGRREGSHENARQIRAGRCGPAGSTYLFSGPTCDRNFSSGAECACERPGCAQHSGAGAHWKPCQQRAKRESRVAGRNERECGCQCVC